MTEHAKRLNRALRLNTQLQAIDERLICCVNNGYMYITDTKTDKNNFAIDGYDNEVIIKEAKKLLEFTWIKLKKVCPDIIGATVWIDKEQPVKIKRFGDLDNLELDRLWVKE